MQVCRYLCILTCEELPIGRRVPGVTVLMVRGATRPADVNARRAGRLERAARRSRRGDLDDARHSPRRARRFPLHSNSYPGLSWVESHTRGVDWLVGWLIVWSFGGHRFSRGSPASRSVLSNSRGTLRVYAGSGIGTIDRGRTPIDRRTP